MRQRVMIAAAMACGPDLLIADEPTTALDVTVQAEILDLMADLKRETGAAMVLITHDMGVIARLADRVCVMKDGAYVEAGEAETLFADPQTDYAKSLLAAIPRLDRDDRGGRPMLGPAPDNAPVVVSGDDVQGLVPGQRGLPRRPSSSCAPSTASASRSARARRWAWSARAAAASPPSRARC